MYRFALRPWWIVSHVVVLAIVVAFVNLGFWQLRRLDEVQARNAQLAERLAEAPVDVAGLIAAGDDRRGRPRGPEGHRHRHLSARRAVVLIRGRSLDDAPGSWVVVPLDLGDGRVVAVNRGWIRNDGRFTAVPEDYRAVPDRRGRRPGPAARLAGAGHPRRRPTRPTGRLESLARVDLDRLDDQVEGDLLPVWVQLTDGRGRPRPTRRPSSSTRRTSTTRAPT